MTTDQLAELSRVLYSPVTLVLYLAAAFVYLYALTTTVGRREERDRGRRAQRLGAVLAIAGIGAHIAHEIIRGLAQSRLPLGNMFEVSSMMALIGVLVGFIYLTFIRRRAELTGFVMLGGALVLVSALLMYAEPGPLMPILDTWWRVFHVSIQIGAMGIFVAGFIFNGLYLLRETADSSLPSLDDQPSASRREGRGSVRAPGGDTATIATDLAPAQDAAYRMSLRAGVSPVRLAIGTAAATTSVAWVFLYSADTLTSGIARLVAINGAMVGAALLARWFVPYLPAKQTLDGLAHRTIVFGFLMWTIGTIAGAMWAEQSWGRFWGWDPKETGAFLTWVAYAGYLHARATSGMRGRKAAWIGIGAFVVLMATYLIANYVIVGLHSYADL